MKKLNLLLIALLLISISSLGCKKDEPKVQERGTKDNIIVLDTSMSMIGKGDKNIMPKVKDSLNGFIDRMLPGETFTFITFDEEVKIYPVVNIETDNDKDIIKKYVSVVEAAGKWTYTMEMFKAVLKKAQEVEASQKQKDRQVVLVILTDALDDPPPSDKKKKLSVRQIAKEYSPSDWFIYFVNLGELKNSAIAQEIKKDLQENVSPYTAVIDGKTDPGAAIDQDVSANIEKMTQIKKAERRRLIIMIILGIIGFIGLVVVLTVVVNKISSMKKVFGLLLYKNEVVLNAKFETIDLAKYESGRVTVGKDSFSEIRISDFESPIQLILEAKKFKGLLKVRINQEKGLKVAFLVGTKDGILNNGDEFSAGGYHFIYKSDSNAK